jgi:trehalose 6-phosphate synthase/phosphatase
VLLSFFRIFYLPLLSLSLPSLFSVRDGLNRYPIEFSLARKEHGKLVVDRIVPYSHRVEGSGKPDQGLVIISEFISSARVMRGALVINPWRVDEVVASLDRVLTMNENERSDRSRRNLEFSNRLTSENWAKYVLSDLKAVENNVDPSASYAVGFGLQYKVMNLKAGFHAIDTKEVAKAFRTSRHRLIMLDWGGTLVPNLDKHDKFHAFALAQGHATQEAPSSELTSVLESLCADSKNLVFVVSGKETRAVAKYFGGIKGLGLGAEHGFYYKWPRDDQASNAWADMPTGTHASFHRGKWQSIMHIADDSWKESAKIIMDIFIQRTHGTYIEQKGNALIWQFSDADPEFGFLQSKELEDHLRAVLGNYPVEIIRGGGVADGYIEVRPVGASKGLFLEHVVSAMKSLNMEADFVLTIGDDSSDEPMFERVALLHKDHPQFPAFSVTVGKKPTAAKSYVDDSNAVLELLTMLSKVQQRDKKYLSVSDLPSRAFGDLSGFATELKKDQSDLQVTYVELFCSLSCFVSRKLFLEPHLTENYQCLNRRSFDSSFLF